MKGFSRNLRLNARYKGVGGSICLAAMCLLPGCAALFITDRVPEGSPKGYVEFYELRPRLYGHEIYSVQNDTKIYEGQMFAPTVFHQKSWRRVAKIPGDYDFVIEFGAPQKLFKMPPQTVRKVRVKILEDMLTLVRIELLTLDV